MADIIHEPRFRIPPPPPRPGGEPDFSDLPVVLAGAAPRPNPTTFSADAPESGPVVRVLDVAGAALGEWNPTLAADEVVDAYRTMLLTRRFDDAMLGLQRQGKASFYVQSRGEEAVSVAAANALRDSGGTLGKGADMHFPTYRQPGLLVAAGHSLVEMACQVLSNDGDRLQGVQLPTMHSVPEAGFFSVSGNLGTQFVQAVGWAMGAALRGNGAVALGWIGDGSTACNDFHSALVFAGDYQPPVVLNVVNNQWAISSFRNLAGRDHASFASRGAAFGIPGIVVDGNDYLASYAVAKWAIERARSGAGPVLIEWLTYRAGAHSTSDDPTRYRADGTEPAWPLGDPIERLRVHAVAHLRVNRSLLDDIDADVERDVDNAVAQAVDRGTLLTRFGTPSMREVFRHVYEHEPPHLREQRQDSGY